MIPWMMTRVFSSTRIPINRPHSACQIDYVLCRRIHTASAIEPAYAVLIQYAIAIVLPRSRAAYHYRESCRIDAAIQQSLDDSTGNQVHARVIEHVGDDRKALDARLRNQKSSKLLYFADGGIAANLTIVRRPATVAQDRVKYRQARAASADNQGDVAVELDDSAGDSPVIDVVDLRARISSSVGSRPRSCRTGIPRSRQSSLPA